MVQAMYKQCPRIESAGQYLEDMSRAYQVGIARKSHGQSHIYKTYINMDVKIYTYKPPPRCSRRWPRNKSRSCAVGVPSYQTFEAATRELTGPSQRLIPNAPPLRVSSSAQFPTPTASAKSPPWYPYNPASDSHDTGATTSPRSASSPSRPHSVPHKPSIHS